MRNLLFICLLLIALTTNACGSQSSIYIPDSNGLVFRNNVNNAFQAVTTKFSGPNAPFPTVAFMEWIDTSAVPAVLKIRDSDNASWIIVANIDTSSTAFVLSNIMPYAGATTDLNMGSHNIITTGNITVGNSVNNGIDKLQVEGSAYISGGINGIISSNISTPSSTAIMHIAPSGIGRNKLVIDSYSVGSPAPGIKLRAARGSVTSPTAVQSQDTLLNIVSNGYGATGYSADRTVLSYLAAENWTDAAQGSVLTFRTTPIGSVSGAERMRIDHNGAVLIGTYTNNGVDALQVAGSVSSTGDITGNSIALSSRAADSAVVHNTGDETIAGVKTFSSIPMFTFGMYAFAPVNIFMDSLNGGHLRLAGTDPTKQLLLGYNTTGNTGIIQALHITTPVPLLLNSQGGNVLIGTATNNGVDALQVAGSVSSTGNMTAATLKQSSGTSTNHAVCWKSTGVLGYCSAVVASDGTCGTCN
jgi:hypothetical protein